MKKLYIEPILAVLIFFMISTGSSGQDMNYSQYFSTPIYYNPAFTGINSGVRARFLFRDQWPSLPSPFKSYYFSADLGDRNLPGSGGIGLLINQDTPGPGTIKNFGAAVTVGVRVPISEFMVSQVGIKAGIMQRTVNWGDLVFSDQLSGKYGNIFQTSFVPPNENQRTVPDFGIGGVLQFMNPEGNINGNIGFAVDHIFQPDVSFLSTGSSVYPRKYVGQFDLMIATGPMGSSSMMRTSDEPLRLMLGGLYQNQANQNALQLGINMLKYNIYIGAWYKTTMSGVINSAVALVAGYRYNFYDDMNLKFMYSYDLQVSSALQGTGGAHEISLILELDKWSLFGGSSGGSFIPGGAGRRGNGGPLECPTFY
jgi:type IX secretion system PorP/SprF family membrane protein